MWKSDESGSLTRGSRSSLTASCSHLNMNQESSFSVDLNIKDPFFLLKTFSYRETVGLAALSGHLSLSVISPLGKMLQVFIVDCQDHEKFLWCMAVILYRLEKTETEYTLADLKAYHLAAWACDELRNFDELRENIQLARIYKEIVDSIE